MKKEARVSVPQHVIRVHHALSDIEADAWNELLGAQAAPTPFMRHEYLAALDSSGSATVATGWQPAFVTVHRRSQLIAAAPAYLKSHSYGEYVFDWAWADAYQRHGLDYYPKLLVAVPFTPVPGTRLMAIDDDARAMLVDALLQLAREVPASSVHVLFHDEADAGPVCRAGWLQRHGVQFHWDAPAAPPASFEALLASMQRDKRKKILQERRKVVEAGISFTVHEGSAIEPEHWEFFHHCYRLTYRAHHSTPYLTRAFFEAMACTMPQHWVMFVAHRAGQRIGASLIAVDARRKHAYGRYWGSTAHVPCLHFEACYYQPLQWCIANGYRRFEGGAQGEHKMSRGLLPVATQSAHWLAHPEFSRAVGDYLARETHGVSAYMDELREHSPFKASTTG